MIVGLAPDVGGGLLSRLSEQALLEQITYNANVTINFYDDLDRFGAKFLAMF
jgi:hypothetical protein